MCVKIWLVRKIEVLELELKYLKLLLLKVDPISEPEIASNIFDIKLIDTYSETDSDDDYSFNADDVKALNHYAKHLKGKTDSDDE